MKSTVGRTFIEKTCYPHLGESDQRLGLPQPPLAHRASVDAVIHDLPEVPESLETNLVELIAKRRSLRSFGERMLTQQELAWLLWSTQGVVREIPGKATFRTVPSAGARHAFETILLINKVEGLEPGLYKYLALDHKLEQLSLDPGLTEAVCEGCLGQAFVRETAVTFLWVAEVQRMCWRYQERGYRYLLLDAGHLCQNLYLAAEAIDCGVCAIAAYDDDKLNQITSCDGVDQFVIYVAGLGPKADQGSK